MYRRFIATIAAASIALSTVGAPAYAGNRDTTRALAAILGLAVVGKIIHDNNKDKKQAQQHQRRDSDTHRPAHKPPRYTQKQHQPQYNQHKPQARPLPRNVDNKLLPGNCFNSYKTRQGRVQMFGSHCLNNSYHFANRLPRQCLSVFSTPRGNRRGYEARCLRDRGYRLAHR
jgi:hypothetical protein